MIRCLYWCYLINDSTATGLRVAKWENAFMEDNGTVVLKGGDFINSDADRFQVFLSDARRTEDTIEATVAQAGSISGNRTVTLYRQTDGTYLSTNLLLVADAEDRNDTALTALGAPPGINQRMFQVALDDTLTVSYTHSGETLTGNAAVGVDVKTLYVDVAVMTINNQLCASFDRVDADMQEIRECLAPANIRLVVNTPHVFMPFNPPPSIAANPASWYADQSNVPGARLMTKEARDVIDASELDLGTDHIRIIYVPFGVKEYNGFAFKGLAFADWLYKYESNDNNRYLDTCFVTAQNDVHYVVPHEIAHILDVDHVLGIPWNLMETWSLSEDGIDGSKRLTQAQVNTIREDERNKLK